jgi:hypothetical protein
VYRPTVRYADVYKQFVDKLFHATTLDRNQIMRAALFTAAHSKEFLDVIQCNKKKDVPLPSPPWELSDSHYWREQEPKTAREERDVNDYNGRKTSDGVVAADIKGATGQPLSNENLLTPVQGRERPVQARTEKGGIKIRIG